jgi:hypothetical protein
MKKILKIFCIMIAACTILFATGSIYTFDDAEFIEFSEGLPAEKIRVDVSTYVDHTGEIIKRIDNITGEVIFDRNDGISWREFSGDNSSSFRSYAGHTGEIVKRIDNNTGEVIFDNSDGMIFPDNSADSAGSGHSIKSQQVSSVYTDTHVHLITNWTTWNGFITSANANTTISGSGFFQLETHNTVSTIAPDNLSIISSATALVDFYAASPSGPIKIKSELYLLLDLIILPCPHTSGTVWPHDTAKQKSGN